MTDPTLHFVDCADPQGGHRMAYWEWGAADSPHVLMCVHGLTRQGRDFDALARALLARAGEPLRIVCPDIVGRGRSDWLRDPQGYQVPTYVVDVLALLAQLHARRPIERFDYLGTSMGGVIGMVLAGSAGLPLPARVRRLVLNDVGPALNPQALMRIADYVGKSGHYASLAEAAAALWQLSSSFGPHTSAQWLELSRHMVVPVSQRGADGRPLPAWQESRSTRDAKDGQGPFVLHYDPAIAQAMPTVTPELMARAEAAAWALYDRIEAHTLVVRGTDSDLLFQAGALQMTQRGPHARLIEFEGVGHAPTFVDRKQARAVVDFLRDDVVAGR